MAGMWRKTSIGSKYIVTEDRSDEVIKAMTDAVNEALEEIGKLGVEYAREVCPYKTHRLERSITYASPTHKGMMFTSDDIEGNKWSYQIPDDVPDGTVMLGTETPYARKIELGNSGLPPRPYLRPALANHYKKFQSIFEEHLKNA